MKKSSTNFIVVNLSHCNPEEEYKQNLHTGCKYVLNFVALLTVQYCSLPFLVLLSFIRFSLYHFILSFNIYFVLYTYANLPYDLKSAICGRENEWKMYRILVYYEN